MSTKENDVENMTETTEYPIATTHLRKGDAITAEKIESAFNVKRGTDPYRFAVMRTIDYVSRSLAERGMPVTVVERKHCVVILTDDEASEHNARRFKAEVAGAARAHRRQLLVDRANVDQAKIAEHDRALVVQGRVMGAINKARRMPDLVAAPRCTPGKLGA